MKKKSRNVRVCGEREGERVVEHSSEFEFFQMQFSAFKTIMKKNNYWEYWRIHRHTINWYQTEAIFNFLFRSYFSISCWVNESPGYHILFAHKSIINLALFSLRCIFNSNKMQRTYIFLLLLLGILNNLFCSISSELYYLFIFFLFFCCTVGSERFIFSLDLRWRWCFYGNKVILHCNGNQKKHNNNNKKSNFNTNLQIHIHGTTIHFIQFLLSTDHSSLSYQF